MFGLIACFPEKASWSLWLDVFWWSLCIVVFVFWCRWLHHHYKCRDCISWQGGLDWKTMFGFAQVVQQFLQLLHHNHYHDHYPLQSIITNTFPDVWTRQESILSCTHGTPFTGGWTQLRHGLIFYWYLMIVMFALNFNNFIALKFYHHLASTLNSIPWVRLIFRRYWDSPLFPKLLRIQWEYNDKEKTKNFSVLLFFFSFTFFPRFTVQWGAIQATPWTLGCGDLKLFYSKFYGPLRGRSGHT